MLFFNIRQWFFSHCLQVTYYSIVNVQINYLVWQEHEYKKCYESHKSCRDFSIKLKHINIDWKTSDMSLNNEVYENSMQVVENFINFDLINDAVMKIKSEVISVTNKIIIKINWTSICERL